MLLGRRRTRKAHGLAHIFEAIPLALRLHYHQAMILNMGADLQRAKLHFQMADLPPSSACRVYLSRPPPVT